MAKKTIRWKGEDPESIEFVDVHCIEETLLALQVVIDEKCRWIPKSLVDDNSEVWKKGDKGTLVVPEWFCVKEGWV